MSSIHLLTPRRSSALLVLRSLLAVAVFVAYTGVCKGDTDVLSGKMQSRADVTETHRLWVEPMMTGVLGVSVWVYRCSEFSNMFHEQSVRRWRWECDPGDGALERDSLDACGNKLVCYSWDFRKYFSPDAAPPKVWTVSIGYELRQESIFSEFHSRTKYPVLTGLFPDCAQPYLLAGDSTQSEHPLVKDFAQSVVGDAKCQADAVARIVSWCADSLGFVWKCPTSTLSVLRDSGRRANCKAATNTAIGLLRSIGIPARYVKGFILAADATIETRQGNIDLFTIDTHHAWLQVFYPDSGVGWVPYDCYGSFNCLDVNRCALAFGIDSSYMRSVKVRWICLPTKRVFPHCKTRSKPEAYVADTEYDLDRVGVLHEPGRAVIGTPVRMDCN